VILAPATTAIPPQPYNHNDPHQPLSHNVTMGLNHNVPEEAAPAYESLQIDRSQNPPPPYSPSSQPEPHGGENSDDETYDYIPTDESDMPRRGQKAILGSRSPAPLPPKPPAERAQLQQCVLPEQYLTVSKDSSDKSTANGGSWPTAEQLENTDGYLAPTANTDGYLAPTANTDGYLAPNANTDGYLSPTANTDGYLAPTDNTSPDYLTLELEDGENSRLHDVSENQIGSDLAPTSISQVYDDAASRVWSDSTWDLLIECTKLWLFLTTKAYDILLCLEVMNALLTFKWLYCSRPNPWCISLDLVNSTSAQSDQYSY
jgi:hypothetical protein